MFKVISKDTQTDIVLSAFIANFKAGPQFWNPSNF